MLAPATLRVLFAGVAVLAGAVTLARLRHSNVIVGLDADPGALGGRYHDERLGRTVTYRFKRLPLALAASFVAGNVSSLLGVGRRVHQGAGAERVVRRSPARGRRDERLHDRGDRHRGRRHLLRARRPRPRARGRRGGLACRSDRVSGCERPRRIDSRWLRLLLAIGAVRRGDRDVRGGAMSAEMPAGAELALGRVLTVGTRVSTACLAAGLVLTFVVPGRAMTGVLLAVGLVVLMATPVARVAVSVAEFARQRRLAVRDLRVHCLCAAGREFGGGAAVSGLFAACPPELKFRLHSKPCSWRWAPGSSFQGASGPRRRFERGRELQPGARSKSLWSPDVRPGGPSTSAIRVPAAALLPGRAERSTGRARTPRCVRP